MKQAIYLTLVSLTVGCGGGGGGGENTAEMVGAATYRDATTDHAGTAQQPAEPPPGSSANVFLVVEGSGDIPNIDPQCALDPAGSFEAHYLGTMTIDDGGVYTSSFGSAATEIVTPSGCEIPELTVGLITNIKVRAELESTTQNCETYCAAAARAEAEQECGADASSAECRTTAEGEASASCNTTCTTQTDTIVAEVSLGASALGQLDASALRAAALGEFQADLTFDHMEDANGNVVEF
jgi:hypothetical protein